MLDIVFNLGKVIIGGIATGNSFLEKTGVLKLSGKCDFYFYDHYRDVIDVINLISGDNLDWPSADTYMIINKRVGNFNGTVYLKKELSSYNYRNN